MPTETASRVLEILTDTFKLSASDLDPSKRLSDYVDSLSLVYARETLERVFGNYISDTVWTGFGTVGDIISYLENQPEKTHARQPEEITSAEVMWDDVEVGMPLTGLMNLAENPLLKLVGDLRWKHVSKISGLPSRLLLDEEGHRLYPTFFYVETIFSEARPMAGYGENDRLRLACTLSRFGSSVLDGYVYLLPPDYPRASEPFISPSQAVAADAPRIRLSNIFVKQFSGAEWLKKARPASPGFNRIREMASPPDSSLLTKQAERDGCFSLPPQHYVPLTDGPQTVDYKLVADRDLNGAGLVYFANYPLFLDICEREVLLKAQLSLTDELIDRRTIVERKSAYLSNASWRDALTVAVEAWIEKPVGHPAPEIAPIRLHLNHRMSRKSDGRLMMVSTAKKILFGRSLEDAPFFDALIHN